VTGAGRKLGSKGHLVAGLVFGVQVKRRLDFAGPHSPAGGSLELLLGTANQVGGAVGTGKPKGRTEFPERASVNSPDRRFVAIFTLGQSDHPA